MEKRIIITGCEAVEDNWGRTTYMDKEKDILEQLIYPLDWTDDVTFIDSDGNRYLIDDLDGKEVEVKGLVYQIDVANEKVTDITLQQ
jgi:predicted RNA-binding protein